MAYIPDPTDVNNPTDIEKATTASAEFRALKLYLRDTILAQLAGKVSANSAPTFTGIVTAAGFKGPLEGDVTGNVSGSAGSVQWTGVQNRPGALSQFVNDVGFVTAADAGAVKSVNGQTGTVSITTANLGIGNVENKSSTQIRNEITYANVINALAFTPYNSSNPAGYITAAALAGYATQGWVVGQNYASKSGAAAFNGKVSGSVAAQNWTGAAHSMEAVNSSGGLAAMGFHRAGAYAIMAGLDTDNVFRIGGWSDGGSSFRMVLGTTGVWFPNRIYAYNGGQGLGRVTWGTGGPAAGGLEGDVHYQYV